MVSFFSRRRRRKRICKLNKIFAEEMRFNSADHNKTLINNKINPFVYESSEKRVLLQVDGLCSLDALHGELKVNGIPCKNKAIISSEMNNGKSAIIEIVQTDENNQIQLNVTPHGKIKFYEINHINLHCINSSIYNNFPWNIYNDTNKCTTIFIGEKHSGKSIMSNLTMNYCRSVCENVFYLETDLGQPSLSLPGYITLLKIDTPIFITNSCCTILKPLFSYFVGEITTQNNIQTFMNYIRKSKCDLDYYCKVQNCQNYQLIINTHGYVKSIGESVLRFIFQIFQPNLVVLLENKSYQIADFIQMFAKKNIIQYDPTLDLLPFYVWDHNEAKIIPNKMNVLHLELYNQFSTPEKHEKKIIRRNAIVSQFFFSCFQMNATFIQRIFFDDDRLQFSFLKNDETIAYKYPFDAQTTYIIMSSLCQSIVSIMNVASNNQYYGLGFCVDADLSKRVLLIYFPEYINTQPFNIIHIKKCINYDIKLKMPFIDYRNLKTPYLPLKSSEVGGKALRNKTINK